MQKCVHTGFPAIFLLCTLTACSNPAVLPAAVIHPEPSESISAETGTVQTEPPPPEHPFLDNTYGGLDCVIIRNVPHYTQFEDYFTACESIATCELLEYCGIDMPLDDFIESYLPRTDYPQHGADGRLYGESAWKAFAGDPRDWGGFGCYNTAIEAAVSKIHKGLAVAAQNIPLQTLCEEHIARGEPVIIWATINMAPASVGFEWITPEGDMFRFINPEHALLLIGYDNESYYFSDSMQYQEVCKYPRAAVEAAYDALEQQCVYIDTQVLAEVPDFWRIQSKFETNQ